MDVPPPPAPPCFDTALAEEPPAAGPGGEPLGRGRTAWLWLGDESWASDVRALEEHGITHRLQCKMSDAESQRWRAAWGTCDCGLCPGATGGSAASAAALERFVRAAGGEGPGGAAAEDEAPTGADGAVAAAAAGGDTFAFRTSEEEVSGWRLSLGVAPLFDDEPFCRHHAEPLLLAAAQFLEQTRAGGGTVYVHCEKGCSRSPAVVLCYLVVHEGLSLLDAATFLKARRARVSPNGALVDVLQRIEARHRPGAGSVRELVEGALHRAWLPDYRAGRVKLNKVDLVV